MKNTNFKLRPIFFVSENEKNNQRAIKFLQADINKYNKIAESSNSSQIELITSGVKIIFNQENVLNDFFQLSNPTNYLYIFSFALNKTRFAVDCIDVFFSSITLSDKAIKQGVSVAKSIIQSQLIPFQDWPVEIKLQITDYYHKLTEKQIEKFHQTMKHEVMLYDAKNIQVNKAIHVTA